MGMVPILRASISRSLRIHVPNISLSNLNSIPKKNELFCTFIRNQNNSAAVKPERELSKLAPSKRANWLREVGMMHSLFTTTMGELLLLLAVSLGMKPYINEFCFLNTTSEFLCLAGGKLDDITVIVGQVVSSQHIFFPWLRIKLVELVENRKKHSNHSYEVLMYSWLLGFLVKFEDPPRKLKVSTFKYIN
ncbi:hypothetical protein NC653_023139 [Populus alba x Populus x berolinensis]|uniref:Uncharacterized protein n=1 Tax=Populus alba x Populus x berolinensis TaxID=444605 RepID=A0AAD6MGT0_9ROSI|nr:hypothetical protein NC653_023139 [Populus alba x Populus x berolinensis]